MTGIHYSSAMLGALRTLALLSSESDKSQIAVATGKKVATAADNPAFWSIATTMRSNVQALSAVKDSIGVALAIVDTALAVADPVLDNMQGVIDDLAMGRDMLDKVNRTTSPIAKRLDADIYARIKLIGDTIVGAYSNKVNLLYRPNNKPTSLDLVVGIDTTGATMSTQTLTLDLKKLALVDGDSSLANFGALSRQYYDPQGRTSNRSFFSRAGFGPGGWQPSLYPSNGSPPTAFTTISIDAHIQMVDTLRAAAIDIFASLGSLKAFLQTQLELTTRQQTTLQKGIGSIVDADLDHESVRLKAIEVQKTLASQVLSLVNQRSSRTLELFRA